MAKIELTTPTPMSWSTPGGVADPARQVVGDALQLAGEVVLVVEVVERVVLLHELGHVLGVLRARCSARFSIWPTSERDQQRAEPDRDQHQREVGERDREPALHAGAASRFTGPDIAIAMNAAITSQVSGVRSRYDQVERERDRDHDQHRAQDRAPERVARCHHRHHRRLIRRTARLSSPARSRLGDGSRQARVRAWPRSSTARSTGPWSPATAGSATRCARGPGTAASRRRPRRLDRCWSPAPARGSAPRRPSGFARGGADRAHAGSRPRARRARPGADLGARPARTGSVLEICDVSSLGVGARVRGRLRRRAPGAARAGQQRRGDAARAHPHRRGLRAHLRHQRPRAVPAHRAAAPGAAARRAVADRQRLLGRHVHAAAATPTTSSSSAASTTRPRSTPTPSAAR